MSKSNIKSNIKYLKSLVNSNNKINANKIIDLFIDRKLSRFNTAIDLINSLNDKRKKAKAIKQIEQIEQKTSVTGRLSRPTKKTINDAKENKKFYVKYAKVLKTTYIKDKKERVFKDKVRSADVVIAKNEQEAIAKLMQSIGDEIEDSGKYTSVWAVEDVFIIPESNIKKGNDIKNIAMFKFSPVKYAFIPADYSMLQNDDQCFTDQFLGRYSAFIKTLNYDKLIRISKQYVTGNLLDIDNPLDYQEWEPSHGYTPARIQYICEKFDISCYAFDCETKCFLKYVSRNCNYPPLVYFSHNQHMHLISDKKYIDLYIGKQAIKESITTNLAIYNNNNNEVESVFTKLTIKEHDNKSITELINENDNCIFILPLNCLNEILENIIKHYNYIPYIKNSKFSITYIHFNDNNKNIHIYSDPNELKHMNYKDIQSLCEKLQVPFNNQSFGALIKSILSSFNAHNAKRVQFSKEERHDIIVRQSNKCNVCFCSFEKLNGNSFHIDHIKPLSAGGSNDTINLQALCIPCHSDKTKKETDNGSYVKLNETESSYNSQVLEVMNSDLCKTWAFIQTINNISTSKKLKKMIDNTVYHIDINKCRKNIMYYGTYEYPVFTVMDSPQIYSNQSGPGLYYVESENYMPLRGNGWYYEPMIDCCLKNGIISTNDIKYVIIASLTITPDYYNDFIKYCYSILGDFAKLSVNSMIGCFKTKDREVWKSLCITADPNEAFYYFLNRDGCFIHSMDINDTKYYQAYNNRIIKPQEFETPLYDMVLQMEIIELYNLTKLVTSLKGIVLDLNTDCVACVFPKEFPFQLENDGVNLSNFYWDKDNSIPKYKLEFKDRIECGKKTNYVRKTVYNHVQPNWTITEDVDNNDMTRLVDHVIEKRLSINVDGRAGCGKTTLIKAIMKEMTDRKISFIALAPTNKACRLIDGKTIHKFALSYRRMEDIKKMKFDYIVVDEISMVSEIFYKFMITMKRLNKCEFIVSGDFAQLMPVNDRRKDYDYKNSAALYELCNGNRIQLSKCRRADNELFTMCLPENITKKELAKQFNNGFHERHICFTNKKRKEINEIMMDKVVKAKKTKCLKIPALKHDTDSQDVKLLKGMPVIARVTNNKYEIMNNETFIITNIDMDNKIITITDNETETEIPFDKFQHIFYIAFCITTHKSQGETYDHPYTIHEFNRMDARLKYVALSRGTKKEHINIV